MIDQDQRNKKERLRCLSFFIVFEWLHIIFTGESLKYRGNILRFFNLLLYDINKLIFGGRIMEQTKDGQIIVVEKAVPKDIQRIIEICSKGYAYTVRNNRNQEIAKKAIQEYYNEERVLREIKETNEKWNGYIVARVDGKVVGAAGGGLWETGVGIIYVIYLDLNYLRQGIGSWLIHYLTEQQVQLGAIKQQVSVLTVSDLGQKFYHALGFRKLYERKHPTDHEYNSYILERSIQ